MPSPLHFFRNLLQYVPSKGKDSTNLPGFFGYPITVPANLEKRYIVKVYYLLQAKRIQVLFRSEMSRTVLMTADIPKYSVMRLLIST